MSDQLAGQPGGEPGSLDTGVSHAADAASEPVSASATEAGAAMDAIVSEPSMPEPSMSEPSLSEPSIAEPVALAAVTAEAAKIEAAKAEAAAPAAQPEAASDKISNVPSKVIVMPRGERAWTGPEIHVEPEAAEAQDNVQDNAFGKRRIAAIAAVLALATMAGAAGGALATASLMHGSGNLASNNAASSSLEASLSRIDGDIQSLKSGLDHTSKVGLSQFNKTTERLDKLERSQVEPAKLAKLSEAIDKLHALPVPPPAVASAAPAASSAAKETTGSIAPAQQVAAASPKADAKADARIDAKGDVKSELGRLPTLDDWVLRDVAYGGALIDGRHRGTYEVYAGDVIPGLGRVDAIRRQDGRWVIVTSRGLIVAR